MLNKGGTITNGSSPHIINCTFTGNTGNLGGAVYNSRYCNPVFTNTNFISNSAITNGGAVYNLRDNTVYSYCTFTDNTAFGTGTLFGGGAMYNSMAATDEGTSINNCNFETNSVDPDSTRGGAIFNRINPGFITISNTTFSGNTGKLGAAIYNSAGNAGNADSSTIIVSGCWFYENEATYGGGIYNDYHNTRIINTEFRGNHALLNGASLYNRYGAPEIVNCLITGGRAVNYGGAVYNTNASPIIINSTISGNYCKRGGAIAGLSGSAPEIYNSILWDNVGSVNGNELFIGTDCSFTIDYSLYSNLSDDVFIDSAGYITATNILTSDPSFYDPYSPTSGNTPNIFGNYRITSGSPALDAGLNSYIPTGITIDLLGKNRIIDGNADNNAVVDIGAYEFDPNDYFVIWTGSENTDWNSISNWIPLAIPTASDSVIIPNVINKPVVSLTTDLPAVCKDVTIETGAVLTIASGKALTVNETITNNAGIDGLIIESDENGTGSLIENNSVPATVRRYLKANNWHFVTAPVDDPTAGVFMGMYLQYWNEPDSVWTDITNPNQVLATDMMGYSVWTDNIGTVEFTGILNTGPKSIAVTAQGPNPDYQGFNLVGNPYPSALNWNADDGDGWTRTSGNILSTLWVWNPLIENYGVYIKDANNGINDVDSIIPPNQGFFIYCNASAGFLGVDNGARVHAAKEILKSEKEITNPVIKLKIKGNEYSDEIIMNIIPEATINYDNELDALKLKGQPVAPQFFSLSNDGRKLSINSFPVSEDYKNIPLCLEVGVNTLYTISVEKLSGFNPMANLYLEDKQENTMTEIKNEMSTYTFTAGPEDKIDRFVFHFNGEMSVPENSSVINDVRVYSLGSEIFITSSRNLNGSVVIYNLIGQKIIGQKLHGESKMNLDLTGQSGYLIVSVITEQGIVNQKVLLRQ